MECNKDEAIRARDIAARKFTESDFSGAKKFALKAQTLYPGLDGISQMLTTLDVHISAANKVGGEKDLYGILGVNPLADDDTIKKQYRKLVLQLHPDKNKSIGADGAFLFVTEAFNVLSDKAKRSAYNTRRHVKIAQKVPSQYGVPGGASGSRPATSGGGMPRNGSGVSQQKVPFYSGSSSFRPEVNGSRKRPSPTPSRGKSQKVVGSQKLSPQVQSFFTKGDTFWTVCAGCKMQYEYMRVYLDQTLKCPTCEHGFVAAEIPPPSNVAPLQADKLSRELPSNSGPHTFGANNSFGGANDSARWSPFSGTTAYSQSTNGSLKRERDDAPTAGNFYLSGEGPSKKTREMNGNYVSGLSQLGPGNQWSTFQGHNLKFNANRELSAIETKTMVAEMALMDIRKKVRNLKSAYVSERGFAGDKSKVKGKERQKSRVVKSRQKPGNHNNHSDSHVGSQSIQEAPEFNVPDPDFHVFDFNRAEHCFKENQVWASYDNDDGMPRFFALIHGVSPLGSSRFKLKLSWLNSRSNTEFGTLDWVGRGFIKTCGDFWVGKYETYSLLNSFSHKLKFDKGPRGTIQIYPGEGQIWALYRNWSTDWNKDTPDEVRHAYEMVEVLQDYKDELGVSVANIIKAPGFQTVYHKQPDPKVVRHIPKEEMFRFSHQVPHHILTGSEKPNAPKGFIELDPAATPLELLHVTPTNEEQVLGTQSQQHQENGKTTF